jgi:hypothetical protein
MAVRVDRAVVVTASADGSGGDESVAGAADGFDPIGSDLAAQVADVDIDDVATGVEVVAPYLRQELFSAEDLVGVAAECFGERELPGWTARRRVRRPGRVGSAGLVPASRP